MNIAPELVYFVKVNLAFILLYGFYRLFFYKDTYFTLRRVVLLLFYVLAFAYPLFNIQDWMKEQQQPLAEVIYSYSGSAPEMVVSPGEGSSSILWQDLIARSALWVYLLVAGGLFVQFLIQIFSIMRIRHKSQRSEIKGTPVYLLPAPAAPFSFFRAIFIYPRSHSEKELEEILTHEATHATQWHSIDVIISKLAAIVCWMNPFIWLLKREVRHNLEYLADNTVIHAGYDSKTYQFHLLGLTHQCSTATLYNNFNVLDLKNRIIMMNKKRSRKIGRAKYFVFLPMAVLLLQFCNIDPEKKDVFQETTAEHSGVDMQEESSKHEGQVFTMVEEMPRYPGGEKKLLEFLKENVKYPAEAEAKGIQGRVIASFVINTDGSTSDYEILRGVDEALDQEALRVIASFPKWIPGKQRGQAVRVKYTVPITFRLNTGDLPDTQNSDGEAPDNVFTVVETMPSFPGGETKLLEFINKEIKYPVDAQEAGKQGRVIASFTVKKDGSIEDIEIKRGVYPSLDEEAKRVLSSMPKWTPGEQRGKPVNVRYTVPITFRLQ